MAEKHRESEGRSFKKGGQRVRDQESELDHLRCGDVLESWVDGGWMDGWDCLKKIGCAFVCLVIGRDNVVDWRSRVYSNQP